jgi:hypothetical protein
MSKSASITSRRWTVRGKADAQNDPKVKQQFLELKRLWLLLAQRCEFNKA